MKKVLILLLLIVSTFRFNLSAQPGIKGVGNITTSNVDVNTYTYLTSNVSSGATSITVNSSSMTGSNFTTGLTAGDLVLIIQMQGASINVVNSASFGSITNYNNAGLYEFKCVASVPNSTTINLTSALTYSYTASGHVQVVRIPRYSSLTLSGAGSIRPAAWNGNIGGITAIEVSGNATINGTINVSGRGFRGGSFENNSDGPSSNINNYYSSSDVHGGNKGESIAGHEANEYAAGNYRYCRGAIANGGGGGNSHNGGGGGGANAGSVAAWNGNGNPNNSGSYSTAWNLEGGSFSSNTSSGGGRGGYTYGSDNRNALSTAPGNGSWGGNNRRNYGGLGGRPLDYSTGRLFFGGGGGAGDGNNSASTGGANGGGLVFIICYGNISGTGTINATGANALSTTGSHNDAPGGGGGGGTIVLAAAGTIANSLTLNANGGTGGNQLITTDESEGPGGGGGGGYIAISSGSPTRVASGGLNGTTTSNAVTEFPPNGATRGGAGTPAATISITSIVGSISASAGPNQDFCKSATMGGNSLLNATGTWSIISGSGGSFVNPNSPTTVFNGDSSQYYTIVWTVVNRLCDTRRDTMLLNPICLPLPVELLNFDGEILDGKTHLNWAVGRQENFKHFELQRQTGSGNWETITIINYYESNSIQYFNYIDESTNTGLTSYRLKMVDYDLTYKYSNILSFNSENNDVLAYPMPVGNQLNLSGYGLKGSVVEILNAVGQTIDVPMDIQYNSVTIDLSGLSTGYYLYKVTKNGHVVTAKTFIREMR